MKRIICDGDALGSMRFDEGVEPTARPDECLVRVHSFSLNRGEVAMAGGCPKGSPIGWDLAGTVETAAASGGPPVGTRVVAFSARMEGWAEQVAIPVDCLAEVPDNVELGMAATLPVAGLTALYCLEKGTRLLGNSLLVTGANGGVGLFALRLGSLMGAHVVAQIRSAAAEQLVRDSGAQNVVVTEDGSGCEKYGPYRLIVDGVGGNQFGALLPLVDKAGVLVSYGVTGGASAQIAIHPDLFGGPGQRSVYGLNLYSERELAPISEGLSRLLPLVADGRLRSHVDREASWDETPQIAADLLERKFSGKAVLYTS